MNNLSALSSFTEMQVRDRDGLRRRLGLKRFREDRYQEAIEALIGAEGDRETEKYMIAKHYGITRDQLRRIEEDGGGGGNRTEVRPSPPPVAPTYVFKDDTDKRRLQQELADAKGELFGEKFFADLALFRLNDLITTLNTQGMAQQELERRLEDARDMLDRTSKKRKQEEAKFQPRVVEEN